MKFSKFGDAFFLISSYIIYGKIYGGRSSPVIVRLTLELIGGLCLPVVGRKVRVGSRWHLLREGPHWLVLIAVALYCEFFQIQNLIFMGQKFIIDIGGAPTLVRSHGQHAEHSVEHVI